MAWVLVPVKERTTHRDSDTDTTALTLTPPHARTRIPSSEYYKKTTEWMNKKVAANTIIDALKAHGLRLDCGKNPDNLEHPELVTETVKAMQQQAKRLQSAREAAAAQTSYQAGAEEQQEDALLRSLLDNIEDDFEDAQTSPPAGAEEEEEEDEDDFELPKELKKRRKRGVKDSFPGSDLTELSEVMVRAAEETSVDTWLKQLKDAGYEGELDGVTAASKKEQVWTGIEWLRENEKPKKKMKPPSKT